MNPTTGTDVLDAIALTRAHVNHDQAALRVLTENVDAAAVVTALVSLYAGLLLQLCGEPGRAVGYLDDIQARLVAPGGPLGSDVR